MTKKRIIALVVCIAIVVGIVVCVNIAQKKQNETKFEFIRESDGTLCVKSYSGTETYVEIPSHHENIPVTSISKDAFLQGSNIKTLIIPDTITYISEGALSGCTSIQSITLPYTIRLNHIFKSKDSDSVPTSLKKVYLSENCIRIDYDAFNDCMFLQEIHIPASVQTIETRELYRVGVNGNIPTTPYEKVYPFKGCSESLILYCESPTQPEYWEENWNHCSDTETVKIVWGHK